jgi:excisionase family DNA binding protein
MQLLFTKGAEIMSVSSTAVAGNSQAEVERAYSIEQAAELLTLSKWTIWKWIADQKIISCKLGGRRVIPASEISRLLRETREENYQVVPRSKKQEEGAAW